MILSKIYRLSVLCLLLAALMSCVTPTKEPDPEEKERIKQDIQFTNERVIQPLYYLSALICDYQYNHAQQFDFSVPPGKKSHFEYLSVIDKTSGHLSLSVKLKESPVNWTLYSSKQVLNGKNVCDYKIGIGQVSENSASKHTLSDKELQHAQAKKQKLKATFNNEIVGKQNQNENLHFMPADKLKQWQSNKELFENESAYLTSRLYLPLKFAEKMQQMKKSEPEPKPKVSGFMSATTELFLMASLCLLLDVDPAQCR